MFRLPYNCTHFIRWHVNAQNPSSCISVICELWTSKCSSWILIGRGTRDQIANNHWIIRKAREFQRNIYFCFIDYAKAFAYVDHNKLWKILRDGITRPPTSCWEICVQVKKQHLELDMEQQTGSKLEKEYVEAVYYHPAYLTYMQSTSCKMPGCMKHKLESRLPAEMSVT